MIHWNDSLESSPEFPNVGGGSVNSLEWTQMDSLE